MNLLTCLQCHEIQQSVETRGLEATIMLMQAAAADIDARMKMIRDGVSRAREEVSSVLDYFGEDPNRNPSEFFTTLASFCTVRFPYLPWSRSGGSN